MINSYRNISFRQLKDIKPMIIRNFAWFNQQSIGQSFGKSKRREKSKYLLSNFRNEIKTSFEKSSHCYCSWFWYILWLS